MNTAEKIYERVKTLPESTVKEIMDFIEFLESKQKHPAVKTGEQTDAWLPNVWGCSPGFPDRLPDPQPEPVESL